jgi:hypothetical protein
MIAHRIHSVFSRRPSVNPEFPSPTVPIHPALPLVHLTPPHPRPVAPPPSAPVTLTPRTPPPLSAMPRSIRTADHASPIHDSLPAVRARPG